MVARGSQSFSAVHSLQILGRWMRMFAIPNQSSVPMAYEFFTPPPLKVTKKVSLDLYQEAIANVLLIVEIFIRYTIAMRPYFNSFGDSFSERK
jgi:arsenic resistance protein ArsH